MIDWFTEGQITGYVTAFLVASLIGFVWYQKKQDLILPIVILLFFLGGVWLLDRAWETPKESMSKSIQEIREAGVNKDWKKVKDLISDQFNHPSLGSKADLEAYFQRWRERLPDCRLVAWGFGIPDKTKNEIEFMFKAEGGGQTFFAKVRATMEPSPKGWRIKGFKLYNPVADLKEIPIP